MRGAVVGGHNHCKGGAQAVSFEVPGFVVGLLLNELCQVSPGEECGAQPRILSRTRFTSESAARMTFSSRPSVWCGQPGTCLGVLDGHHIDVDVYPCSGGSCPGCIDGGGDVADDVGVGHLEQFRGKIHDGAGKEDQLCRRFRSLDECVLDGRCPCGLEVVSTGGELVRVDDALERVLVGVGEAQGLGYSPSALR